MFYRNVQAFELALIPGNACLIEALVRTFLIGIFVETIALRDARSLVLPPAGKRVVS